MMVQVLRKEDRINYKLRTLDYGRQKIKPRREGSDMNNDTKEVITRRFAETIRLYRIMLILCVGLNLIAIFSFVWSIPWFIRQDVGDGPAKIGICFGLTLLSVAVAYQLGKTKAANLACEYVLSEDKKRNGDIFGLRYPPEVIEKGLREMPIDNLEKLACDVSSPSYVDTILGGIDIGCVLSFYIGTWELRVFSKRDFLKISELIRTIAIERWGKERPGRSAR